MVEVMSLSKHVSALRVDGGESHGEYMLADVDCLIGPLGHTICGEKKFSIQNEIVHEGFKSVYDIALNKPIILFQLGNTYGWFED